jgi:hypothetical protein
MMVSQKTPHKLVQFFFLDVPVPVVQNYNKLMIVCPVMFAHLSHYTPISWLQKTTHFPRSVIPSWMNPI